MTLSLQPHRTLLSYQGTPREVVPVIAPPYDAPEGCHWRCVAVQLTPGMDGWECHSFWALERSEAPLALSEE